MRLRKRRWTTPRKQKSLQPPVAVEKEEAEAGEAVEEPREREQKLLLLLPVVARIVVVVVVVRRNGTRSQTLRYFFFFLKNYKLPCACSVSCSLLKMTSKIRKQISTSSTKTLAWSARPPMWAPTNKQTKSFLSKARGFSLIISKMEEGLLLEAGRHI
jgi:hypothetical protein